LIQLLKEGLRELARASNNLLYTKLKVYRIDLTHELSRDNYEL